jgi:hypothetical protein
MSSLGESMIGFHSIIDELFEISKIQGELDVKTLKIQEGSVELINVLEVVISSAPFHSPLALYDFLEATDINLLKQAQEFFSAIGNTGKGINDFLNENNFLGSTVANLIPIYLTYLIGKQQGRKESDAETKIPKRYGNRLEQLRNKNTYKRALKPLIDGEFKSIKIIAPESTTSAGEVVISEEHLDDYLSGDSTILPEFINGKEMTMIARVVGLQSTRGETIKLRVDNIDPNNNLLVAHAPEGVGAEQFREMYGETVILSAEVYRKTMHKRPELILRSMEKHQQQLDLDT